MKRYFVDANVFLRFIINEGGDQHKEAEQIFLEAAQGKKRLFTSVVVFFEVYWVLKSFYKREKEELVEILKDILNLFFIDFEKRELLEKTVSSFENKSLDFVGCYHLEYALEKDMEICSFDKRFQRFFLES